MKSVKKELPKKTMKKTKGGAGLGDQAADILDRMQASNMAMLNIQAGIGAQNRTYTAVSNALSAKQAMERNVIRNMRS